MISERGGIWYTEISIKAKLSQEKGERDWIKKKEQQGI